MAVVFFKEIHRGRQGQTSFSTEWKIEYEYVRVFLVRTDNNFDDKKTIEDYIRSHSSTCPWIGDIYPTDQNARVERIQYKNEDASKLIWTVTYEYTRATIQSDPSHEDPIIRWSTEYRQKPAATHWLPTTGGWAESLILNTAGDPFDPPAMMDDSRWMLHVSKNILNMNEVRVLLDYKDAVNSDAVIVDGIQFAAGELKLMEMQVSEWYKRGIFNYRTLAVTMAIDKLDNWDLILLNVGLRQKDPQNPTKRKYCVIDGDANAPVSGPVLLDQDGYQVNNPLVSDLAEAKLEFDVYNRLEFAGYVPGCSKA